jgi:hypothetical protein
MIVSSAQILVSTFQFLHCTFADDVSASAMPLLEHNISANQHLFPSTRPQTAVLDWDKDLPDYIYDMQGGFHAIMYVFYLSQPFPTRNLVSPVSVD